MAKQKKQHMFDDPVNVKRVIYALYVVCGLSLLGRSVCSPSRGSPLGSAVRFLLPVRFCACVVLVLIAKEMRKVLMRGEDYYGD